MNRFGFGVALLVVVVCLPGVAQAQVLSQIEESAEFYLGGFQLSPSVKAGYQRMSLNVNLPVPYIEDSFFLLWKTGALDLKLVDAGVWIGGVQLDGRRGRFLAFLGGQANARKKAGARTQEDPHRFAFVKPVEWTVTGLEWWTLDGGLGYYFNQSAGIVGGMRLERLSFKLTDPRDRFGLFASWQKWLPSESGADFLTRTWVPYVGIRIDGDFFKGLLRFSPVAFASVKIPISYTGDFSGLGPVFVDFEKAEYSFKRRCLWIDINVESSIQVSPGLRFTVWVQGNWHWLQGKGYEEHSYQWWGDIGTPAIDPQGVIHGSADGKYTFSTVAAGVGGEYTF